MRPALAAITEQYTIALRAYLGGGGEAPLLRAYELGRQAVADGLGVLELAAIHQESVVHALLQMLAPERSTRVAQRAAAFFAETLAPFEMTQRGIQEANGILRDLNRQLEERIAAVLGDFEAAQNQIEQHRRMQRLKDEFISLVSHELRTPLTSIHGSLGLIISGVGGSQLSPAAARLLEVAHRNSQRLVRLVSEILDLQRIESGAISFELRPLDVRTLVEQAVEANQTFARTLGVRLAITEVADGACIRADGDRVMQVLTNVLSNAAQFSAPGDVVSVAVTRRPGTIRFAVHDAGPGIPVQFQSRVFEQFAQADSSATRARGGTGLGLSISKAIVERLGGDIGFTSEIGRGTTFHIELPEWQPDARTTAAGGGVPGDEAPAR